MIPYAAQTDFVAILPGADPDILGAVIEAVSRQIDAVTGHEFFATTETREFEMKRDSPLYNDFSLPQFSYPPDCCLIGDFLPDGSEDVTLDGAALGPEAYEFFPLNGTPKQAIRIKNAGGSRIAISGKWGYSETVPAGVHVACLLLVRLTYKATVEKQLTSERTGTYSATFAASEAAPTPELYRTLLRGFCKVKSA